MTSQQHMFSADIQQLMHLIIHTFYSNKDVFLRELISNASDALDKVRYASLQDKDVLKNESSLRIRLTLDKANKRIMIEDTGIGMDDVDMKNNIGTIASSGTKRFIDALQEQVSDVQQIGQFGVGFYSAFLVANRLIVRSKKLDKQYIWESNGETSFTINEDIDASPDDILTRGTRLELYLRDDAESYLEESKIRDIIKTHSQFISFPIQLLVNKTREIEVETEPTETKYDNEDDSKEEESEITVEEVKEKKSNEKKVETYTEWEDLNDQKPVWSRNASEVTDEEYQSFYKSISGQYDNFKKHIHFAVEGQADVKGILFIPSKKPYDMFQQQGSDRKNIKLYVKRVFVTDSFTDLLPEYMNFMYGVVNSDDLPLTVSREMLRHNKVIKVIKKTLVKQAIKMIQSLTKNSEGEDDEDTYLAFYNEFSKNIKLGVHEDDKNRNSLLPLLRFASSIKQEGKYSSLDEYVERMKEHQPGIYYMTGDKLQQMRNSSFLQRVQKKGYEVLLMDDPLDEYLTQKVTEYKDKKLICITKEGVDLGESETDKESMTQYEETYAPLCEYMKKILDKRVENVVVTDSLTTSPCCMVTSSYGLSPNMERIMRAQTLGDKNNFMLQMMAGKKILQLNPTHPLIRGLAVRHNRGDDLTDTIALLHESSSLSAGYDIDRPDELAKLIFGIVSSPVEKESLDSELESVRKKFLKRKDEQAKLAEEKAKDNAKKDVNNELLQKQEVKLDDIQEEIENDVVCE